MDIVTASPVPRAKITGGVGQIYQPQEGEEKIEPDPD
jgi:hypothetical protein